MTDTEELREQIRRLNDALRDCIEIQHHVLDIGLMYPACRNKLIAISDLAKKANNNIAWVNTRLSMECFHLTDQD